MTDRCCDHQEKHTHPETARLRSFGASTLRFFGWFVGFSGLYSMSSVCPFCGRQGCPTGAWMIGIVLAVMMQGGRAFRTLLAKFSFPDRQ
jgi:hypothetical protein